MKMHVTPEMAKQWLDSSGKNYRSTRSTRVRSYAEQMKAGLWVYNGELIKLNCTGGVVDGKHRLCAVVMSGITIETEVISGITAVDNIDTGMTRNLSDVIAYHGERNVTGLASALNWLARYKLGRERDSNARVSPAVALSLLGECPGIRDLYCGTADESVKWMRHGWAWAWRYMCWRSDKDIYAKFQDSVMSGVLLNDGDPALALRKFMSNNLALPAWKRADALQCFAVSVKAWNANMTGKSTRLLSYRRGGDDPEQFPRLIGFETVTPE